MKTINKYIVLLLLTLSFSLISCEETEDIEIGTTNTVEASGDWWIQFLDPDGNDLTGFVLITTTNTSSNSSTEFIIDDRLHTWWFKVVCPIDINSLSFSGSSLPSNVDDYEVDVNITNGSITEEGATSTGGNIVDGIFFNAEFSDDPGVIYTITGYKRTGLAEDEH